MVASLFCLKNPYHHILRPGIELTSAELHLLEGPSLRTLFWLSYRSRGPFQWIERSWDAKIMMMTSKIMFDEGEAMSDEYWWFTSHLFVCQRDNNNNNDNIGNNNKKQRKEKNLVIGEDNFVFLVSLFSLTNDWIPKMDKLTEFFYYGAFHDLRHKNGLLVYWQWVCEMRLYWYYYTEIW